MAQKINKTDARRLATFEKFVKNANHQLKKSAEETNDIFDAQNKILSGISVAELKNKFLAISKDLRKTTLSSLSNFDSIIANLHDYEKILEWKNLKEILNFFDDVDKGVSKIPDQRMRHQLIKQAQY